MSLKRKLKVGEQRRKLRVRSALHSKTRTARVSVFRSLKYIYAQIIDETMGKTVASCSSLELENVSGDKKAVAHTVGLELAKRAKKQGITELVFDRGKYRYHGRVQALAEGLREGGLKI